MSLFNNDFICLRNFSYITYWEKISQIFKTKAKDGIECFSLSFPHRGDMDNEDKITVYAMDNGYRVKDEKLSPTESIYLFEKK